jgi:CBS domain-containing protein
MLSSPCGAGSRCSQDWSLTEVIGMRRTLAAEPSLVATLTTVEQVMSTELIAVDPSANLMEAAGAMSAGAAGSVLVIEDGALVGIFTERDVLRALEYSSSADLARVSSVSKWMSRDPVTIGPHTTVAEALNQMLFGGFRHLPVMGGDAVVGMVSMRDLARSIAEH